MTNEQINQTIAESLGWTCISESNARDGLFGYAPNASDLGLVHVPDYCNDLNACVEFEKELIEKYGCASELQCTPLNQYASYLEEAIGHGSYLFEATARQKCEAYLKTIGEGEKL